MTYAHVLRNGELKFSTSPTFEGLIIAEGSGKKWRQQIEVLCRLAYDGDTYLVPGVPEAENQNDALKAVIKFRHTVAWRFLPETKRKKISWADYVAKKMKNFKPCDVLQTNE